MVKKLMSTIVNDYPEYTELNTILALAGATWPKFGLSAGELSALYNDDPYLFELVRLAVE